MFMGRRSDVPQFPSAADLFVFPSEREGMSNALMEAMAHALPCIASDIPGNRALIDSHRDGLLLPLDHPATFTTAVLQLFGAPAAATRLGTAAREKVLRQFGIESIAEQYIALYTRLLTSECPRA
jgi:glycosyltransferase involved in cell wall biosynthesis